MATKENYHPGYADGDTVDRGFGLLLAALGIGLFVFLMVLGMRSVQSDAERLRTDRTRNTATEPDLAGDNTEPGIR